MNPFDWKTVLLAKHAQHVVLIHFPIALFFVAVGLDLLALRWRRPELSAAAYYNLVVAAIFVAPTLFTGLVAWQWQLDGQRLKGVLLYHLIFAMSSAVVIVWSWWVHFQARRSSQGKLPRWRVFLEIVGVGLLMVTGHLGGFLSGVNGPA